MRLQKRITELENKILFHTELGNTTRVEFMKAELNQLINKLNKSK